MKIISIEELNNTNKISDLCNEAKEPIFIIKNGYADMVIMSLKTYEEKKDAVWREEALTQNFIRAYDASGSEKVVGIYGDAHCDPRRKAGKNEKGCMARQLQDAYGDVISYEAIESMVKIESDKMLEKQPSGKK